MFSLISLNTNANSKLTAHAGKVAITSALLVFTGGLFAYNLLGGPKSFLAKMPAAGYATVGISLPFVFDTIRYIHKYYQNKIHCRDRNTSDIDLTDSDSDVDQRTPVVSSAVPVRDQKRSSNTNIPINENRGISTSMQDETSLSKEEDILRYADQLCAHKWHDDIYSVDVHGGDVFRSPATVVLNRGDVKNQIIADLAKVPPLERGEIVNYILQLTEETPRLEKAVGGLLGRLHMIRALAGIPANERKEVMKYVLSLITPYMPSRAIKMVIWFMARIPSAEREEAARALQLCIANARFLTPEGICVTTAITSLEAPIVVLAHQIPAGERVTAVEHALLLKTNKPDDRQDSELFVLGAILDGLANIPIDKRERAIRAVIPRLTPDMGVTQKIKLVKKYIELSNFREDRTRILIVD